MGLFIKNLKKCFIILEILVQDQGSSRFKVWWVLTSTTGALSLCILEGAICVFLDGIDGRTRQEEHHVLTWQNSRRTREINSL
jgi:hypothetical protein